MRETEIKEILESFYKIDMHYEDGKILGSMYTKPPDIVLYAFFKFYQANLGNAGLYSGTLKMEREVVNFLLTLTSGKQNFFGHILSGGTEANITALWAARECGYKRVLLTDDAHFSIIKAAKLLKLDIKYIDMIEGRMDISSLDSTIKDDDIIVATAGTTPLGFIDPIADIGKICKQYRCFLHVDAAFGGYVIPFLRELGYTTKRFGFEIDEVQSITIDPHKMGLAPYPAGGLVSRENIFEKISVNAPYLINGKNDTLLGTRQSGSVAAAYAAILYFGWNGYKELVKNCMNMTRYITKRAEEEGFQIFSQPEMNIINISIKDPNKIKMELIKKGWGISINPKYNTIRIVVMPHITQKIIETFFRDLKKIKRDYLL